MNEIKINDIVTHYLRYTHIYHFIIWKFTSNSYRLAKVKWTVTGDFQRKKGVRLLILWNFVDRRPHTSLGFDLDKAPGLTSPTRGLEQPEFVGTAYVSLLHTRVCPTYWYYSYVLSWIWLTEGSGSMFISISGCVFSLRAVVYIAYLPSLH